MAYGLDVTDLIYTDQNRKDLGTLDSYEVDLDLAGEKNFELSIDEFLIPEKGFWYVEGTEYGGVIDGFETDSTAGYRIKYKGRSWRGILNSRVIFDTDGRGSISVGGDLTDVINGLLKRYNLNSLFVCDKVDLDTIAANQIIIENLLCDENGNVLVDEQGEVLAESDLNLPSVTVSETALPIGKTVYDAMVKIGDNMGFNYTLKYNLKDKKVHIVPGTTVDYTDFLTYSTDNSLKFKFIRNGNIVNHLICCGRDENAKQRVIHLFTDESGNIQPYSKVAKPKQDSEYILDESKKVITGIYEIVELYDANVTAEENYVLLTSQPSDWARNYSSYYKKQINQTIGEEEIHTVNNSNRVTLSYVAQKGHLKVKQGSNDLIENSDYWIIDHKDESNVIEFSSSYKNEPVTIARITDGTEKQNITVNNNLYATLPYNTTSGKLTVMQGNTILVEGVDYWFPNNGESGSVLEFKDTYRNKKLTVSQAEQESYENVTGNNKDTYTALYSPPTDWPNTYSYYYKRSWNQSEMAYEYQAVSANTELDYSRVRKISTKPTDWAVNYGQYYYYFQTGTNRELRTYSSTTEDVYTPLPNKPDDWDANVSSYYKKQYTIKTSDGTETNYDSYVRGSTVTWGSLQNGSNGKAPTFVKNKYYRRDGKTVIPPFNAANCYLPGSRSSTPEFNAGAIFKKTSSVVAPPFTKNTYYKLYLDHFFSMVEGGIDHLKGLRSQDSQNIEIGETTMNIGDMVGGRDDITGYVTAEKVTNIIIKINRGVLDAEYEIGGQ